MRKVRYAFFVVPEKARACHSSVASRRFCRDCGTPIERRFGIESRLAWVKFCEDVSEEITGQSPGAAEFLAKMESHQGKEGG